MAEDEKPLTVPCPRCGCDIEEDDIRSMWGQVTRIQSGRYPDEPALFGPTQCCDTLLTLEEVKTLWGKLTSAKRETHSPGPGRPRSSDRCPCGKMTKARALQRRHICRPPRKKKK